MSKVPLKASTMPAASRYPKPASAPAANVTSIPATVTWLGVTGRRATAAASRSALRRTQAWNLLVNIFDSRTRDLASAAVDVYDAGGDLAPGVAASFGQPAGSQSRAQVAVAGEHGE